ncbi:bifunctional adenosylcobinamide kinase/adenosylcobinamide-phosphate guanylyltransferase [Desulfurivibrio sp. D14AmB]|uniref:bifunctional adenosylcobinamide kinase/adenosylcobinamide-phosphate guanylyltransferase n=1 Tax=Desulfurivibrio sp. D14AmB TaxID=3374370 RepID=UPI00376F3B68
MKELILGGARSGKSALAEELALASGLAVTYLATAEAGDAEMRERIRHHRERRPAQWGVVEVGCDLAGELVKRAAVGHCLLVDCLTLWLTRLLIDPEPERLARERDELLLVLPGLPGRIIMVSNETGLGVVPLGEISRRFCDESGRLHQQLARVCDRVVLTVAGLPQVLKGERIT